MNVLKALALAVGLSSALGSGLRTRGGFSDAEFQDLLQRFVDQQYHKGFEALGEESDFDHGHLLFGPASPRRPLAILYHTRELSSLEHKDRNWLQWTDSGRVVDAARYERASYPPGAAWDWFREMELPILRRHHTILDKMLDPVPFGGRLAASRQWVFTRVACSRASDQPRRVEIALPGGPPVCLALAEG